MLCRNRSSIPELYSDGLCAVMAERIDQALPAELIWKATASHAQAPKYPLLPILTANGVSSAEKWISHQNSLSSWQPDDMMRRLKFLEYVTGLAPRQMEALHDFLQDWSPAVL